MSTDKAFNDPTVDCCGRDAADCDCPPQYEAEARKLGAERGLAAASWVFDGNTPQRTYRAFLRAWDDGDPVLDNYAPTSGWLSGEWADTPTPDTLARDLGITDPDEIDAACDAYEDAATEAYWAELERVARLMVGE